MTLPSARRLSLTALFLGAVSAAFALAGLLQRAEAVHAPRPTEAEVVELDLAFYLARVARDSYAARDQAELARLYLQRARTSGAGAADLERAEAYARRSLTIRGARNEEAYQVLAASLMGQHRFAEARTVAERLLAADPAARPTRGMLGEILLELGDYAAADRLFGSLYTVRGEPAVAPRYARWEEIRGRPAEARRLLRLARDEAMTRHAMPQSQLAWYHWRLGDLALRQGHLNEAERELGAGLTLAAEDHRLLDGLARLALARGRWREAIAFGERAIARTLDPATLGLLAMANQAAGDTARAAEFERAMSVAVLGQSNQFHRVWSLFLLDRGRDIPAVLSRAQAEMRTRHDVYGWDLLAWALHRSGREAEAREAMVRALAMGTRDPMLYFHAGAIDAALGRRKSARRHLQMALAINPRWHPFQPDEAKEILRRLREPSPQRVIPSEGEGSAHPASNPGRQDPSPSLGMTGVARTPNRASP
jgi:tetratricopeptide (TPR) repeat protein